MTSPEATRPILVRESVQIELDPAKAFTLFTDGMNEWWPLNKGFSFGGERAMSIHLEPWPDGRIYEHRDDGDSFETGRVTECDAPNRIVFTWKDVEDRGTMEVEVSFEAPWSRSNITGVERLGPAGPELAARYRRWLAPGPGAVHAASPGRVTFAGCRRPFNQLLGEMTATTESPGGRLGFCWSGKKASGGIRRVLSARVWPAPGLR